MDAEWAAHALRARRRGKAAVEQVAGLIAKETHQRVCDEVYLDWFLETHSQKKIGKEEERNGENVILLPVKEEAWMYP